MGWFPVLCTAAAYGCDDGSTLVVSIVCLRAVVVWVLGVDACHSEAVNA